MHLFPPAWRARRAKKKELELFFLWRDATRYILRRQLADGATKMLPRRGFCGFNTRVLRILGQPRFIIGHSMNVECTNVERRLDVTGMHLGGITFLYRNAQ